MSPTPATVGLIALDSITAPTKIIFNPSTNIADAQKYYISLISKFTGSTATKTSAPATFTYTCPVTQYDIIDLSDLTYIRGDP